MRLDTILVAVDGSKHADAAFDAALELAQKYDSKLLVLHAFQGSTGTGTLVSSVGEDALESIGQEVLKSYEKKIQKANFARARTILERGDPAQRIIKTAKSEKCGLVVVGSRGLGGFKELLLGSVSHKVASHASCPVLIVR